MYLRYDTKIHLPSIWIRQGTQFKEVSKLRYRYKIKIQILLQGPCVNRLGASIIVTTLKYLYLLPNGVSGRYGRILSM